jgi:hypothetical protein
MHHPISQFLANHFPELDHPKYQSALERISFLLIAAILMGLLAASILLLWYEL